jgi:hypothetical protein
MQYRTSIVDVPQRLTVRRIATEGILAYDIDNAYPQRVMDIIKGSGTAFRCNEIYAKFITGQGFADQSFYKAKVNQLGQTNDFILRKTANDLAMFRGFAFHVNYNANYQVTDVYSIPFEHCRLAVEKDSYTPYAVAVYDDWNKRRLKQIKKENIDIINFFNPEKVEEEVIEAGGFDKYKGQILYFSVDGHEYPTATADPVLEDCVTDGQIKVKKYRDITTNFMASHIYINRAVTEDGDSTDDLNGVLSSFQGSENSSKIMRVDSAEESQDPKLIKVDYQDTDKLFEYTESSVQDNIRMNYGMASILIGKEVSGKLGTAGEEIEAVESYNKKTADERLIIEEVYKKIFAFYYMPINPTDDYSIIPLTATSENVDSQNLATVIGIGGVQAITTILVDPVLTTEQKTNMIRVIFGVDENSAKAMVYGTTITE